MTGTFVSIEGIEGLGKSTAVAFMQTYLTQLGKQVLLTREPGGTPIAEQIRQILLFPSHEEEMAPETELLLMFASRAQHVQKVIIPALKKDQWVISDRFVDASYAYQGGGRHLDFSYIEMLEKWIVGSVRPQLTILLDAPHFIGVERAKNREQKDRIEKEKSEFFERARQGYLRRAEQEKERFRIVDATQSVEKVREQLAIILNGLIKS